LQDKCKSAGVAFIVATAADGLVSNVGSARALPETAGLYVSFPDDQDLGRLAGRAR